MVKISNDKISESEIVSRAQQGDKEAEEFLLEKYRKNVLIRLDLIIWSVAITKT